MNILCKWALIGYFLVLILPMPRNKKIAIIQLIIAGPLCWVIFISMAISEWRKNHV